MPQLQTPPSSPQLQQNQQPHLQVRIQSRDQVLYDGPAISISSINDTGPFSILPFHANFITLLSNEIKVVDLEKKEHIFKVNNGVLRIEENKAEVYLGVKIDLSPSL